MKKQSLSLLAGLIIGASPMLATADPILTGFNHVGLDANISEDFGSEVHGPYGGYAYTHQFLGNYLMNGTEYSHFNIGVNGSVGLIEASEGFGWGVANFDAAFTPFLSSIDTFCNDCGSIYMGMSDDRTTTAITWSNVAQAMGDSDARNTFQMVVIDRSGMPIPDNSGGLGGIGPQDLPLVSDFDIEFRYGELSWNGLNGGAGDTVAFAGIVPDANDISSIVHLPGSGTPDVNELANTTNVEGGEAGVWRFEYRNGELQDPVFSAPAPTGSTGTGTADDPFMPIENDSDLPGWAFEIIVGPEEVIFIDPEVAIGYDYYVDNGENFASVILPTGFDDNLFDLWLLDANGDWILQSDLLTGGVEYFFGPDGVSAFRIMGIDITGMLDPTDPTAFVTGVSFVDNGSGQPQQQSIRQVAIAQEVNDVSEPNGLALMLLALGGIVAMSRRKKKCIA